MSATQPFSRAHVDFGLVALRAAIIVLTLGTAAIHWTLGGMLFTLNALGYALFAVAIVLPGPLGRIRWLVRLGLIGFTTATIVGWLLIGARFQLAYFDKALEIILVAAVVADIWLSDGGPIEIGRRLIGRPSTVRS
jgi:hypothetical protein